jgi:hypothetical protein
MDAEIGTRITLHDAQQVSSYLHIVASTTRALGAFARGLSRDTRGVEQKGYATVYLSADAMVDIAFHRQFVKAMFYDCRCIYSSMQRLDLLSRLPDETDDELTQRQRDASDYVLFSDSRGISESQPDIDGTTTRSWEDCWMVAPGGTDNDHQDDIIIDWHRSIWTPLYEHSSIQKELNIAILEMLTSARALHAFLLGNKCKRSHPTNTVHIHVMTDNENSYHRMLKNKGTHPIVPFILRTLSYLQIDYNAMFTYGVIKSVDNRFTDAGSRSWKTPYGLQALERSRTQVENPILPDWWKNIQNQIECSPPTASATKRRKSTHQQKNPSENMPL